MSDKVVYNLLGRHRAELESNGLRVLRGSELREYETFTLKVSSRAAKSCPQGRRNSLAVYTRRTVLNVAMLLRDSRVAQQVRAYLLDAEEDARTASATVTHVESAVGDIGAVLQELGPVIGRMSVRLERVDNRLEEMDRRLTNTDRVVGAMSERLCSVGEDMRRMRDDLNDVARDRSSRRRRG